jgi:hypothetical protein
MFVTLTTFYRLTVLVGSFGFMSKRDFAPVVIKVEPAVMKVKQGFLGISFALKP